MSAKSARGSVPVSQSVNKNESKISEVQLELNKTTDVLRDNIQMQLMNVQAAEEVSIKAEEMRHQADVFRKTARDTKLHFCWQHYKLILLVLLILGVVGVVIWLIITGGKTGN